MAKHLDLARVYDAKTVEELREVYDEWAEGYDAQVFEDYGYRGHELVVAKVRPRLSDDALLLDAGAGSGMVGLAARAAGFATIDAMDISTGMLERARNRGIYRDIRVGVLGETLDYKTDSYDAVLSSGVFTPGHAPPGSFSELARIVRPGGFICFSLRHDATPPGFHETMKALADEGRWELVEVSDPYQPMPKGEPEVEHRLWLYRVLR